MNTVHSGSSSRWLHLFASICLVLVLSVASPLAAQSTERDAEAIEVIDAALTRFAEGGQLSGSVLIARGAEILLEKGYGYAVAGWEVANTPETVYRIGSITKQFTAMAILKLQENGLLTVDDLICIHLEECPESWSAITIHHLLTHTSGIPNYTDDYAVLSKLMYSTVGSAAVVDSFIDEPLQFEPGTNWSYSNSGYHLLGDIIARAAGVSYRRYLQETFFEPLGMESTDLERNTSIISNMAEGYSTGRSRAAYINMNVPYSAGALISTVGDLLKWEQALFNGQVVSQASLDTMWEGAFPLDEQQEYGYGLIRETQDGRVSISHGGGINGFTSLMIYLPEADLTVIMLTNREDTPMDVLAPLILDEMLKIPEASAP